MATLNGAGRTSIDPKHLECFKAPPKYQLLKGPLKLYRFGKRKDMWWFNPSLMKELKEDYLDAVYGHGPMQTGFDVTDALRYGLAISRQWSSHKHANKIVWVWTLTLRQGEALDAFVGVAAPQPEWAGMTGSPELAGGLIQYAIYEIGMVPPQNFTDAPLSSMMARWS
jgi:hypothetical protein